MKMIIIPLPVSDKIKENNIYYKLNPLMKGKGAIIYMILTEIMEEPRNCSDKFQNINGREAGLSVHASSHLGLHPRYVSHRTARIHLIVWISETLQELRDVITQHVIYGLYHFRLQPLKFVYAVTTQYLPEMVDVREIPRRQMELPLDLYIYILTKDEDD